MKGAGLFLTETLSKLTVVEVSVVHEDVVANESRRGYIPVAMMFDVLVVWVEEYYGVAVLLLICSSMTR